MRSDPTGRRLSVLALTLLVGCVGRPPVGRSRVGRCPIDRYPIALICRGVATWLLDLNTLKWARQDPVSGTQVTKGCCNYQTFSAYDPVSDAVYYVDDDGIFWRYDARTNTQTQYNSIYTGTSLALTSEVDTDRHLFVTVGSGYLWQSDLTASPPAITDITAQASGCNALISAGYPRLRL